MPYKIGWILTGDYQLASSRLQGYRVHEYFLEQGFDSNIIGINFGKCESGYSSMFFSLAREIIKRKIKIVIFQKPGWMMFKMSEILRLNGIKTIAIQCDPFPGQYSYYFDSVVTTTFSLKKLLDLPSAYVIDDMIEVPTNIHKTSYSQTSNKLKVIWVGQGTGPGGKKFILPFINKLKESSNLKYKIDFMTISKGDWATYQWSLDSVYSQICACDLAIIPLPNDEWSNTKSSNRLTMFMALGMPVIASPIQSYHSIASHGQNCFIAKNEKQFENYILEFFSEDKRERIGKEARNYAREHYSTDYIGQKWVNFLQEVIDQESDNHFPKKKASITTKTIYSVIRLISIF